MVYLALSETASTPGVKFSFYLCGRPEANRNNGAPRAICYSLLPRVHALSCIPIVPACIHRQVTTSS